MLALSPITAAAATTTTGISGLELFPGIHFGATVYGATFAGWTDNVNTSAPTSWAPPSIASGGSWGLTINYTGVPGAGRTVVVTGGLWSLRKADGASYSGNVFGGTVTWPAIGANIGCGEDMAKVGLALAIAAGGTGQVDGCLDDQHLTTVFPPHVWSTVSLSPAPPPSEGGGDT
jgi:hypothetical protein